MSSNQKYGPRPSSRATVEPIFARTSVKFACASTVVPFTTRATRASTAPLLQTLREMLKGTLANGPIAYGARPLRDEHGDLAGSIVGDVMGAGAFIMIMLPPLLICVDIV